MGAKLVESRRAEHTHLQAGRNSEDRRNPPLARSGIVPAPDDERRLAGRRFLARTGECGARVSPATDPQGKRRLGHRNVGLPRPPPRAAFLQTVVARVPLPVRTWMAHTVALTGKRSYTTAAAERVSWKRCHPWVADVA